MHRGRCRASRLHPRADRRHITPPTFATSRAHWQERAWSSTSKGMHGPSCCGWWKRCADQCTLVPVVAGEITSQAELAPGPQPTDWRRGQDIQVRACVELFVDSMPAAPIEWAASVGADRIELYTERSRARSRRRETGRESFETFAGAARSPIARAWGSTPATISTSTISRCFGAFRSSTRSRLVTRSCRARCLSGWIRSSASTSKFWRPPDMIGVS